MMGWGTHTFESSDFILENDICDPKHIVVLESRPLHVTATWPMRSLT